MRLLKVTWILVCTFVLASEFSTSFCSSEPDMSWDMREFLEYLVTQNSSLNDDEMATEVPEVNTEDYESYDTEHAFTEYLGVPSSRSNDDPGVLEDQKKRSDLSLENREISDASGIVRVERVPKPKIIDNGPSHGATSIHPEHGSSYVVQTVGKTNITRLAIARHNETSAKRPWLRKRPPTPLWHTTTQMPESITEVIWSKPTKAINAPQWNPLEGHNQVVGRTKVEKRVTGLNAPSESTVHWVKASNSYEVSKAQPTTTPNPKFNNLPIKTTPAPITVPHQPYNSTSTYKTTTPSTTVKTHHWTKDWTIPTTQAPLTTTTTSAYYKVQPGSVTQMPWLITPSSTKSTNFLYWNKYETTISPSKSPTTLSPVTEPFLDYRSKSVTSTRPTSSPYSTLLRTTTLISTAFKSASPVPFPNTPSTYYQGSQKSEVTPNKANVVPKNKVAHPSKEAPQQKMFMTPNDVANGGNLWWVPKPGYQFPTNSPIDESPYDYGDSPSPRPTYDDDYDYPDFVTIFNTLPPPTAKPIFATKRPRPPQFFTTTPPTTTTKIPLKQKYYDQPQTNIQVVEHNTYIDSLQTLPTPLNHFYNYHLKSSSSTAPKKGTTTPPTLVYLIDNKSTARPYVSPQANTNEDDGSYVIVNVWNYVKGQLTLMGQQKVPTTLFQGMDLADGDTMHVSDAPPEVLEMLTYKNPELVSSLVKKPNSAYYYQSTARPYTTTYKPWSTTFWTPRLQDSTTRVYGGVGNPSFEGVVKVVNKPPNNVKPVMPNNSGNNKGPNLSGSTASKPLPVVGFGSPHLEAVLPDFFLDAFPAASPSTIYSVPSTRVPTTTRRTPAPRTTVKPTNGSVAVNRNNGRNTLMALGLSMLPTVAMALPFLGRKKRSSIDSGPDVTQEVTDATSMLNQYSDFISLSDNHLSLNCSAIVAEEDRAAKAVQKTSPPDPKQYELSFVKKCLHFLATYERQVHARMLNIVV